MNILFLIEKFHLIFTEHFLFQSLEQFSSLLFFLEISNFQQVFQNFKGAWPNYEPRIDFLIFQARWANRFLACAHFDFSFVLFHSAILWSLSIFPFLPPFSDIILFFHYTHHSKFLSNQKTVPSLFSPILFKFRSLRAKFDQFQVCNFIFSKD